jgi:hypothetical protein
MLAETMDPVTAGDAAAGRALPPLEPVQVARDDEVEALVRAARAGIAMLSLQLRSARQDAELVEQRAQESDLTGARDLIDTSLEHWMESRRLQMAQELEQAREDAANLVSTAHEEAAEVVARASEETLAVLLAGMRGRPEGVAPSLRVVPEQRAAPVAPLVPSGHPAVAPVMTPSIAPAPEVEPVPEPGAGPVVVPVVAPDPVPVVEPVPGPLPQPAVITMSETTSTPAVVVAPGTPTSAESTSATAPGRLEGFLYLDVLLPMVAVLVVLIVLLAWVG